jgi:hypothetical protein
MSHVRGMRQVYLAAAPIHGVKVIVDMTRTLEWTVIPVGFVKITVNQVLFVVI